MAGRGEKIGNAYIEISADLSNVRTGLREMDREIRQETGKKRDAKLGLDKSRFDLVYKEGLRELARLERKEIKLRLRRKLEGAAEVRAEFEKLRRELDGMKVTMDVDIDRSALSRFAQLRQAFSGSLGQSAYRDRITGITLAAGLAAGALSALTAATLTLGGAIAPLVGVLAGVPPALAGLGLVAGSLVATFGGISDAVKAAGEASTKSATDNTAALEQQKAAADAVASAKTGLANSQRAALFAQQSLTEARKDAARTLEDMKNKSRDAALAEQGSALALREAQAELDRVASDPKSTLLEIERAQLGIKQAQQSAREARTEASRAERDSARAQAGGVEKTPQVISARRSLADANRSVAESTRALARAQEQAVAGGAGLSASQKKLNETMAKLSPAGRQFTRFLVSLKPAFRSIRDASQEAALPHFQKGIEGAMKNLPIFRQALTNTSRVLGVAAENMGKFAGSKGFGKDFQIISRANNNLLRNFGRAMVPLGKAFNDVAVAAAPFTRWIGRAVLHLAKLTEKSAKAGRESGGLARFLRRTRTVIEEVSKTIGNLVHGLGGLFGAAFPAGKGFLELMTRLSGKFDDWANSAKGQNSIKKFLEDSKGPLKDLGDSFVALARMVKDLVAAPGSGVGFDLFVRTVGLLAKFISLLTKIPGVGGMVANIALLAVVLGRYGKLGASVKLMRELAGGLRGITAAQAADSGTLSRGFGQSLRDGLSRLGPQVKNIWRSMFGHTAMSTVGNKAGEQLAFDFGDASTSRLRKLRTRIKDILGRIFGRAGSDAGARAGAEAAGGLAGSTVAIRKSGGRLGRIFGRAFGIGILAGVALAGVWLVDKILTDWRMPIHKVGRKIGEAMMNGIIEAINFGSGLVNKILDKVPGVGKEAIPKIGKVDWRDWDDSDAPRAKTRMRDGRSQVFIRGKWREEHTEEQAPRGGRTPRPSSTPSRTKTVEIQTPILSLKAEDVERSMNRIQRVLRRELGQARRLIERQVGSWDEVFKGFRLLRGDDPLHLASGIRKSLDNGRQAIRGVVDALGRVLERLSVLFRREGFEAGTELARGLRNGVSPAVRAAERIRIGVNEEFRRMQRGSSESARELVSNLRQTFGRLDEVVREPTRKMLQIVLTAMRSLGATGRGKVVTAVDKLETKAMGGFVGKARGGYIEGQGLRDTVPLNLPPGAVVETRHQQPVIDYAVQMAKRLRYAVGGLVPVIAAPGERVRFPEEIPQVQRALAVTAAEGLQPFRSLEEVFGTIQRPHYAAEGGRVPSVTQTVSRKFVGDAPPPPTITQRVVQKFAKGGKTRGIVPIPGQPGESIHSSIVNQVVSLMGRYRGQVTDGYAPTGHAAGGEHPKGLAIDVVPGEGGSWGRIDKLAAWAEPSQGSPRAPFRWVGYTGDAGHGRGNHLHLSWGGDGGSIVTTPRIRTKTKGPRGAMRELVSGVMDKVRSAANRRLRRAEGSLTGTSSPVGETGPAPKGKVRGWLTAALKATGHFTPGNLRALYGRAIQESGGDPRAINLWDSNAKAGVPSKGLLQTIDPTFQAHKMKGHGNIYNPVDNAIAAIRYMFKRYGHIVGPSGSGYARGGFVQRLASGGRVERWRESLSRRTTDTSRERARGHLAEARKAEKRGGLDHVFPRHGLSNTRGHERLTPDQVVKLAQDVGLPGRPFERIAKGESMYYPGIVGNDPGGTKGYGLTQVTTKVNGEPFERVVQQLGGWGQMLNPIKNLKAAKWLYRKAGLRPWNRTRYLADGGVVPRFARGGMVGRLSRLPGGGRLTSALSKYDDLLGQYAAVGQQLSGMAIGGTVQTPHGPAPTLSSDDRYVLRGHALRSGKRKRDKKPRKGKKSKGTRALVGVVDDFSLQPYTATFADEVMSGLLDGVDALIDPQLELLVEDYGRVEQAAGASTEEYVVTEDKLGKPVAPFIDQTIVQRRLGELDKLIRIKGAVAAKMQQIVAAVEYAIQLLVSGVLRRQKAVKAIEAKAKRNERKIKDLKDKLGEDGGGGVKKAIALLAERGRLSERDENHVERIWRAVFGRGESPPMYTSGERKGDIKEDAALRRLRNARDDYQSKVAGFEAQNIALTGTDGLKSQVESNAGVWEPNITTMGDHLTTYRGHGGGWLAFDPFKAGRVSDISKLLPPATPEQILAYKPFTGSLGEALWTLERDTHPFPDGSLISERAELLNQPSGGVLDTILKKAQASSGISKSADLEAFMTAIGDLFKQHGSNFKPLFTGKIGLPSFAGGGIVQGPRGAPITATVHGEEIIVDPRTGDKIDMREFIKQLVEAMRPGGETKVVNVDARPSFNEVPADPHTFSRALAFELEAAI